MIPKLTVRYLSYTIFYGTQVFLKVMQNRENYVKPPEGGYGRTWCFLGSYIWSHKSELSRTLPRGTSRAFERKIRFMKVMKAYTGTGSGVVGVGGLGRPDGKSTLTKRLADELAGVSSAEISRHESWNRLRGVHLAKKKAEKQVRLTVKTPSGLMLGVHLAKKKGEQTGIV